MNRVYSFAIKLQDLFSPQMQRIATMYEQRTSFMQRIWSKFEGMLKGSSQTVSNLRSKLAGLGSGFKLKLDSGDLDRASTKTSGLLTKLRSLAGQSAIIGGLVGGGVMGVIDTVMAQVGNGYDKTVGAAQRKESTMFSLNELMGKDVAAKLVSDITKYAPAQRDELLTSSQKLSGAGVAPEKMMDTLKALNNIAAITNTKVDELAMIQAKIKATGYVQGDEINMFKERGINLNPYLAKVMGAKEGDISKLQSKGLITYDIFDKAMQAFAGRGGRFDGAAERKAQLTDGREDATGARFNAIMEDYGKKMLPFKNGLLNMLMDVMSGTGPVVAVFQKLWGTISPIFEGVQGLLKSFKILNEQGQVSQWVFDTLGVAWDYLTKLFEVAGGVIYGVSSVIGWLVDSKLAMLIIGIWGAVKAWGALNVIMSMNPFALVVIGIAAVVAGIMYCWEKFDGFRETVLRVWETVKSVFGNIGLIIKTMMTGTVGDMIDLVKKVWNEGLTNGANSVNQDRIDRLNEKRAGRREREGKGGVHGDISFKPDPAAGGGSIASAAGLNSTVGNSKSSSVVINIKSLIEKSDINIMDFQGSYDELESKLIDALLRVSNSGTRAITA